MTMKFLSALLAKSEDVEATGTYADGVFHLTLAEQVAADRRNCLRASYERDHRTAMKMENGQAALA